MGPFPAAREPFTIGTLVEPLMALRAGDRLDVYDIGCCQALVRGAGLLRPPLNSEARQALFLTDSR